MKNRLLVILSIAAIAGGCTGFKSGPKSAAAFAPAGDALEMVVEAHNRFAFDLYRRYSFASGNIFFSPYSISTALAMTYEGAKGATAEEMQSVFYFPQDENTRRSGYEILCGDINRKDKKYTLSTANALWAQKDYPFLQGYFAAVEKHYGGRVVNMDFVKAPEISRRKINRWVEEQTGDKIKDLIPSGLIGPLTRLVLTNAIYFKGEWVRQFDSKKTEEQDFKVAQDKTSRVPMMQSAGPDSVFNYAENSALQILEMPYSGNELSMLLLLPKRHDIKPMEEMLSPSKLSEWKRVMKEQRVDVFIPRFKFETKYFMAKDLADMGMKTAFTGSADFTGMSGKRELFISEVVHQAFVEVNEEGTEAAAATAVVMRLTAMHPGEPAVPVFRADRPFIFIIQQKATGHILFLGRVGNPAS